ncbi:MAG: cellulase family glycosylhydrolase [Anaerolineaceae bacterium]|nr:cellulase family glycosylhydrolase [Anaerolineaceae bacterium]
MLFIIISTLLISTSSIFQVAGQTNESPTVYLPLIRNPLSQSTFGAELSTPKFSSVLPRVEESGIYWVRANGLLWSQVQPNNSNEWNWQNVASLEAGLSQAFPTGAQVILVIRSTPVWAQLYPGYFCGPMAADKIAVFKNFVKEAVKRYSAPPFNIRYYEVWNEPDADPYTTNLSTDSEWGCWGKQSDPYYGGGYYADMLKQVYPAVKSANPNAQLLIGGLLLDCDPFQPGTPGRCGSEAASRAPKFFEGVLRNGGGSFFDIVNYHAYTQYSSSENPILSEKTYTTWEKRGGIVQGKISYLRELMSSYAIDKPLFQSEAALRLINSTNPTGFEQAKADYLVWLYTRNISQGLLGTTWFTLDGPGWDSAGLLDAQQAPLPAYQALKFIVRELAGHAYDKSISYPDVAGFQFSRGNSKVWVLFSEDNNSHAVPIPVDFSKAFDVAGNSILPSNGTLVIQHPIYIEFNP